MAEKSIEAPTEMELSRPMLAGETGKTSLSLPSLPEAKTKSV